MPRRSRLNQAEVARYRREGVVVPDYRIPAAMLARPCDAVDRAASHAETVDR